VRPDAAALLALAESVADGSAIDWTSAEARASAEERAVIRELRILSDLAGLHRSLPAVPGGVPAAMLARRTGAAPAIGSWAHLTLIERLGGGTSGDVYRAWDRHLEREVALKLLRGDASVEDLAESRIAREGRLLARVRHPNVITVYGVAAHDHRVGLWMDLVRGVTLEQQLATHGPLSAREAALVGIDLCRALAAIHAAGLIHRDVKAQNVMREDGGRIVLMDLGTGRELGPEGPRAVPDLAGTPLYIAPEIFSGAKASERTDLYGLGVLLYHLVTGAFPVRATTMQELHAGHKHGRGVRLRDARADLPTAFVRVVDRAIATDPAKRYETAGAFETDLVESLAAATYAPEAVAAGSAGTRARWLTSPRVGMLAATIAVAVLLFGAIGWPALRGRRAPAVAPGAIRSLAVLPLVNLSGDPAQEYFADGMTDELIGTLGRLGGLKVISQTSVAHFKGSGLKLPAIARQLNVDAVIEGSILVTPGGRAHDTGGEPRVRISARLILAGTDMQLWNRTFEHVLTDVIALQSEVANAVAEEIHMQLTPAERRALAGQASRNPEAENAYLEGRSHLTNSARVGLTSAREALERAVRLDPTHARAHASLSIAYVWLELVGGLSRADARSLAMASARRALQLDANLPEAHAALADVQLFYDWDWASAGAAYTRALTISPSYTFARRQYAWYLAAMGRTAEALEQARLAEGADPLSADARAVVAMMLYYHRQHDDAIVQMRKALALAPDGAQLHNGLARAYAAKRAFPEAIGELREAVRLSGQAPLYVAELARTLAESGDTVTARRMLEELRRMGQGSQVFVTPLSFAYVHTALGEKDRAFGFLEQSMRDRTPDALWAMVDPRLDPLRDDPRFADVLRRLAIPRLR
jgi:TolB-like protein/Tfp pilus assembly protein PilF